MVILERFADKIMPIPISGCYVWIGALANGYACVRIAGRTKKVTRLLMEQSLNRVLGSTEHVLHTCDVACCVNPAHLSLGSHAENMRQVWLRKPPNRKGEGVGRAKLTLLQVEAIRASTKSLRKLAKEYSVAPSTIFCVKHNRTWSY